MKAKTYFQAHLPNTASGKPDNAGSYDNYAIAKPPSRNRSPVFEIIKSPNVSTIKGIRDEIRMKALRQQLET